MRPDHVKIVPLDWIESSIIQTLPVNTISTFSLDMLDFYSSSDVLGSLVANSGGIPMHYHDDALVSYAKLELTSVPLPPAAWAGVLLLACLLVVRRLGR